VAISGDCSAPRYVFAVWLLICFRKCISIHQYIYRSKVGRMFNSILDPFYSTTYITLIVIYFFLSCITTFDTRLIQAMKAGILPADEPMLPPIAGLLVWIEWEVLLVMLILNVKAAAIVYGIRFVLKVLPVLETLGNIFSKFLFKRQSS
jgi:hypothetical protein